MFMQKALFPIFFMMESYTLHVFRIYFIHVSGNGLLN